MSWLRRRTLRQRLVLAGAAWTIGTVVVGVVGVGALRAQRAEIARAETVFRDQLGPVIDLAQLLPQARRPLPDAPTSAAAPPGVRGQWQAQRRAVTHGLADVRAAGLSDAVSPRLERAEAAWAQASVAGDALLADAASPQDVLAFDRPFRQLRAEVAGILGELQPIVAEPLAVTRDELGRLGTQVTAVVSLAGVVSLSAMALLLASVLRPVRELQAVAHQLAEGDLDARAPRSYGEFDELAAVFNLMAGRLATERAALAHRATRDGLTGVLNAQEVKGRLTAEIARARREAGAVGLLMLDLDHFKHVNDTYGHQAGDQVLVTVARTIEGCLRPGDVVGRYGGEEFAVVLPGAGREQAGRVGERIRATVATTPVMLAGGEVLSLTTSVGAATAVPSASGSRAAQQAEALVGEADAALYRAKAEGRDRVVIADVTPPSP